MKPNALIFLLIIVTINNPILGQYTNPGKGKIFQSISIELLGSSINPNANYQLFIPVNTGRIIPLPEIIAGYRIRKQGIDLYSHGYNFSAFFGFGINGYRKNYFSIGLGLGYEKGRISAAYYNRKSDSNMSLVQYTRIRYSKNFNKSRLSLGVSLYYGVKLYEFSSIKSPYWEKEINNFRSWLLPSFSIGYCFGKKYFQKDKIVTE